MDRDLLLFPAVFSLIEDGMLVQNEGIDSHPKPVSIL